MGSGPLRALSAAGIPGGRDRAAENPRLGQKLLHAGRAADLQRRRAVARREAQLERQEGTAAALEEHQLERVPDSLPSLRAWR